MGIEFEDQVKSPLTTEEVTFFTLGLCDAKQGRERFLVGLVCLRIDFHGGGLIIAIQPQVPFGNEQWFQGG